MAKKDWEVIRKSKQGVVVERKSDGKKVKLLNPNGKGNKYAHELIGGVRLTNTGKQKVTENGEPMQLTKAQRAYRSGYLDARKDNAKAFKAKNK